MKVVTVVGTRPEIVRLSRVMPALDQADGVWPCVSFFECTRVCPRRIKVTYLINLTKKRITEFRKSKGEKTRAKP